MQIRSLCTVLIFTCACCVGAVAQTQAERDQAAKQATEMIRRREIPEVTLPSTPEETSWWNELRAAGKHVETARGDKKAKARFLQLIKDGLDRSYRVPVPDRGPTFLWRTQPRYTEEARRKMIRGWVALTVELRADGNVGEVTVAQGLDPGLDRSSVEATREIVFLPMIKDRKFVPFVTPVTMSFNVY